MVAKDERWLKYVIFSFASVIASVKMKPPSGTQGGKEVPSALFLGRFELTTSTHGQRFAATYYFFQIPDNYINAASSTQFCNKYFGALKCPPY